MKITKKVYMAFASVVVAMGALVALNMVGADAKALTAPGTRRDCTAEDIIYCGALSQTELLQKYDSNEGDVQAIFTYFGVKRSDIAGTTAEVKLGKLKLDGTIVVDGKTVATNAQSTYRIRTKAEAQPFTVNGKTYYKLPVKGVYYKEADVFALFKDGQFFQAVQTSCGNIITATPEKPPVTPIYTCDSLKAELQERDRFKFTAAATAKNGAKIVNYTYDFGDGKVVTQDESTVHTYAKPGTYTAKVTVNVMVDAKTGKIKTVTGKDCQTTVTVKAVPVTPVYVCNSLTAQIVNNKTRTYAYTLGYTAEGGATLKKVVYDFGDTKTATYEAAKATRVEHTYAKEGSYRTTATLYFNVKSGSTVVEKSVKCEVAINVSPETCPLPGKTHLPKNSPECAEKHENCPVPGKENLPKDSTECVQTPPELPQTGIGGLLSGGLGLSSLTTAGYYWVNSRKNLIDTLRRR